VWVEAFIEVATRWDANGTSGLAAGKCIAVAAFALTPNNASGPHQLAITEIV
jgi:hypothetical protein